MKCLTLCVCLLASAPSLLAADLYVPGDHATIQAAIGAAATGDTIHVAAGTWVEALDFLGKDVRVVATVGPALTELRAPMTKGPAATFQSGEGAGAVLEGFHIAENGNSDYLPMISITGSGPTLIGLELTGMEVAAIKAVDGDPTITSCAILGESSFSGAGIELRRSDAKISLTSIHDLTQPAIHSTQSSSPSVDRCTLYDCGVGFQASSDLAPLAGDTSHPLLTRNTFARNYTDHANGAAIIIWASLSVTATDNLFLDHASKVLNAGGEPALATDSLTFERNQIYADFAWTDQLSIGSIGTVVLRNNVFGLDPAATQAGAAFSINGAQNITVESNTVSGFNNASAIFSSGPWIFQGGLFAYQTSIYLAFYGHSPEYAAATNLAGAGTSVVPITDPGFVDRAGRDLHLRASSVCLDGTAITSATLDVDGDPRLAPPDYGADELQPTSLWVSGSPLSGDAMRLVIQGPPGSPVLLGIATDLLPTPIPTAFGNLELGAGLTLLPLGALASDGLLQIPFTAPVTTAPFPLFTQALVGTQLTTAREVLLGG